jgi:hypothetical protein
LKNRIDQLEKEIENQENFIDLTNTRITDITTLRSGGMYAKKSYYLTSAYNWCLEIDEFGVLCLIPTKKRNK